MDIEEYGAGIEGHGTGIEGHGVGIEGHGVGVRRNGVSCTKVKLPKIITRRRAKWTGLAATLCVAATMIASYWLWPTCTRKGPNTSTLWRIGVTPGGFYVLRDETTAAPFASRYKDWRIDARGGWMSKRSDLLSRRLRLDPSFKWLPRDRWTGRAGSGFQYWVIPLWMPLVLLAVPTGILFYRDRKPKPGCCLKCKYDLAGLSGDTCPECGTKIAATASHKAPASTAQGKGDEAGGENGVGLGENGVS